MKKKISDNLKKAKATPKTSIKKYRKNSIISSGLNNDDDYNGYLVST